MEAAYGLAINITFLMTTILMTYYLAKMKLPRYIVGSFLVVYLIIELTLLFSNGVKIVHGGWFTIVLASILFMVMLCWWWARHIKNRYRRYVAIDLYFNMLSDLSQDESMPRFASQLVYLTSASFKSEIETKIIYSILHKKPKRADVYWFVHVDVTDEPYTSEYEVLQLVPGKVIRIDFKLGFRVEQQISLLFRKVVEKMVKNGEIDITTPYNSLKKYNTTADFQFVILEKVLSQTSQLNFIQRIVLDVYSLLRRLSLSEVKGFGLDSSFVTVERVPLVVAKTKEIKLKRIK